MFIREFKQNFGCFLGETSLEKTSKCFFGGGGRGGGDPNPVTSKTDTPKNSSEYQTIRF